MGDGDRRQRSVDSAAARGFGVTRLPDPDPPTLPLIQYRAQLLTGLGVADDPQHS